jgi:hypothetical protein
MPAPNSITSNQRIDVRGEGIEKVVADACRLSFVETVSVDQVTAGGTKNPDLHDT